MYLEYFLMSSAEKSPTFYGMALSFYPQHGLNVCVLEGKNETQIAESAKRPTWSEKDPKKLVDTYGRLLSDIGDVAKWQRDEFPQAKSGYSMPIIIGWPGISQVPSLEPLLTRAVTLRKNPSIDAVSSYIRDAIIDIVMSVDPDTDTSSVVFSTFSVQTDAPVVDRESPVFKTVDGKYAAYHAAALNGDQDAVEILKLFALQEAKTIANTARDAWGSEEAATVRFFSFDHPFHAWLNIADIPEIMALIKTTLKTSLSIPAEDEIDVRFPNSPKRPPFFNITRVMMVNRMRKFLGNM